MFVTFCKVGLEACEAGENRRTNANNLLGNGAAHCPFFFPSMTMVSHLHSKLRVSVFSLSNLEH